MADIVKEKDIEALVEAGRLSPVEQPPALPSNFNALTNPYPAGSLPLTMQYAPDLLNTQSRGGSIPQIRLMPVAPAGQASVNSANQSAIAPVQKTVTQAQTTANTANANASAAQTRLRVRHPESARSRHKPSWRLFRGNFNRFLSHR